MNILKNKFLSFITYSASAIGGIVTINYKEPWYSLLVKLSYNPSDWIFGPVWTYALFIYDNCYLEDLV